MGKSDSDHRKLETPPDRERDYLILMAGYAVCSSKAPLPPGLEAIYSGSGVHVGPSHGKLKKGARLTVKFSFDRAAAGKNADKIFTALQSVLGGGEVPFKMDGSESWDDKGRKTLRR